MINIAIFDFLGSSSGGAAGMGGIGGMALGWVNTIFFWVIIIVVLVVVFFIYLVLRKSRKLKHPVLEQVDFGGGNVGFLNTKGGWFRSKMAFNLLDYGGELVFKLKDGRVVEGASTHDYVDINGHKGFLVARKPDDAKVVIPISSMELDEESKREIFSIAPAILRDASGRILQEAERETRSSLEKYLPWISLMLCSIIIFIIVLLVTQYAKYSIDKASSTLLEVTKMVKPLVPTGATASTGGAPLLLPLLFKRKKNGSA